MRSFGKIRRVVVKVGTNLLSSNTGVDRERIRSIVSQIARVKKEGGLATNANNPVQTRRLYHIAEGFIQSIQKL